jgi:hypothetical protein
MSKRTSDVPASRGRGRPRKVASIPKEEVVADCFEFEPSFFWQGGQKIRLRGRTAPAIPDYITCSIGYGLISKPVVSTAGNTYR